MDSDIKNTLLQIVGKDKEKPGKIISDQKLIKKWNQLLNELEKILYELEDEDGAYIDQEHHWEPPYFCGYSLANDLDAVAEKMIPYLDSIYELGYEKSYFFEKFMMDIEDAIERYPEWMGAEDSEFCPGKNFTQCLLTWKKLTSKSIKNFIISLLEIEDGFRYMWFQTESFIDFFIAMEQNECKQVYEYIKNNQNTGDWKDRLNSIHKHWRVIYSQFYAIFETENFQKNSFNLLQENWKCGLPIIEKLFEQKDYKQAEKICQETILGFMKKETWEPEKTLLIKEIENLDLPYYDNVELTKILNKWAVIASKLGMNERKTALRIQTVTYEKTYNWDEVLKIFHKIKSPLISNFLKQWQGIIIFSTLEREKIDDCWIKWLIDASLENFKNKEIALNRFYTKIGNWLSNLSTMSSWNKNQRKSFFILTSDLASISNLKKQYPNLFDLLYQRNDKEDISRQKWLKKIKGKELLPLLINCWKSNIKKLIPNPSNARKTNYKYNVQWLMTCKELNQAAFQEILDQWKIEHKRKRNLWKAIKDKGLVV